MRILLLTAIFLIISPSLCAQQQTNKPVTCWPSPQLFDALAHKYAEFPVFTARVVTTNSTNLVAVLVNPVTKSWTIIEFSDEQACVIMHGDGYVITHDAHDAHDREHSV